MQPRPVAGVLTLALLLSACGGGGGSSHNPHTTYGIGGTITGLTAAGLVLANGNDTVSPAAGATSFTFATALESGANYAVTVMTQPQNEMCQVANGSGQVASAAVTNVMVTCTRAWGWLSGSSTVNAAGVYGTLDVAAATNVPGARYSSVSWTDSAGDLWLFGGEGTGSLATQLLLNDLWRYSPGTGQWTWVSGSSTGNTAGAYGTLGVAATTNAPGARYSAVSWSDSAGDLWLFGGVGLDSAGTEGELNDLWRYSPGSGQWTWVSGLSTVNAAGVYGTQGVAAATNVPGARYSSVSWTDGAGNLWLFGGWSRPSVYLNDLWRYSPGTGQWTWVSGSSTVNAAGVYGTQGAAAATNVPGARGGSVSWTDNAGNLWLFGGDGIDSAQHIGPYLNDLWRYAPGTGQWTWVSGSNVARAEGVYGTLGVPAATNVPGARGYSASWTDSVGNLWLFGGAGWDSVGALGALNDLWVY